MPESNGDRHQTLRRLGPLTWTEAAGALGDLGTFLPLWLGMVIICGVDPAVSLILTGAANIATGAIFGIPMPVQPMKAIAAVAIAMALTQGQIAAAGMTVGAIVLLIGLVGGFDRLQRWIPKGVVCGIQWAVALQLMMAGTQLMATDAGQLRPWLGPDGLWWAPLGLVTLLLLRTNRLVPGSIAVLAGGLIGAAWLSGATDHGTTAAGIGWTVIVPSLSEWTSGAMLGLAGQLPMTALNSVVAVCALAWSLSPQRSGHVTPRSVSVSVGLLNLLTVPFGGLPICHGSGGLAAQYSFGARTGTSVVLLGVGKIIVGLLCAGPALVLLTSFPKALLGAWIVVAGIELLRHTVNASRRDAAIAILVPAGVVATVPLAWAACGTWLIHATVSKIRRF